MVEKRVDRTQDVGASGHTPKVSVVLPTFNSATYLKDAVESVLAQTYHDFELLVIDDGSTDNTRQVITPYLDRIVYHYQENQGESAARNLAISMAQGEYVAFLDSDDLWFPDNLRHQVQVMDNLPEIGLVAGGYLFADEAGQPLAEHRPWQSYPQLNLSAWLQSCPIIPSATMVRRQWLEQVGGFDPALRRGEDRDLGLRLAYLGCRMMWTPCIISIYRIHGEQLTRDGQSQNEDTLAALDKFFAQPDLPKELQQERQASYVAAYLSGAFREYGAGQVAAAKQSLREALDRDPGLMSGHLPRLASVMVAWAVNPVTGDPFAYLSRFLANLPPAASRMASFRDHLFGMVGLRSAVNEWLVGNEATAARYLAETHKNTGKLFDTPEQFIEELVKLARELEPTRQIDCIEAIYRNLPADHLQLRRFRRKTLARLYMAQAFNNHKRGNVAGTREAVACGILYDPTWLRNRGARAILVRSLVGTLWPHKDSKTKAT